MTRPHRAVVLAAALAVATALLASGCSGGDDEGGGVASLRKVGAAAGTPSATASGDVEREVLAYVECLRGAGIDVPDPTVDADGNLRLRPPSGAGGGGGGAVGFDQEKFEAAREKCGEPPRGLTAGFTEGDRARFADAALKFARCMRAEGIDVPDPDFSGGGPGPGGPGGGGGPFGRLDLDDPEVSAALEKCQKVFTDAGLARPGARGNG